VYSPSTWRPRRRPLPHPVFFFVRLPPPVLYSFLVVATDTLVLAFYSIPAALPYSPRGTASSIAAAVCSTTTAIAAATIASPISAATVPRLCR